MTMPLANDCEISVYYSFDYFDDGPFGFHDAAYAIHDEKSPLVEVIAHKKSKRSKGGANLSSELPGRRLILSHEKGLESSGSAGNPYPFHKQGGIPVFDKEFDSAIGAKALKLMKEGFDHSIQLAFPAGPNDSILNCDWPFGEAIFHVFTRVRKTEFQFRYCWG
jgi:hypothetical protein